MSLTAISTRWRPGAAGKAGGSPLIVAGDFNAPHRAWGYSRATRKGDDLWQAAANHDLTLVTDPAFLTRIGNSCSRDTTPDLTFVKNVGAVSWHNLNEDLGSDHNILATCINVKSKPLKEFTITDWDQFRKSREERALIQDSSIDLERWKGQRLNRRLPKKIAELNRTIEDHCQSLTRQKWDEVCNSVDGQMRAGGKWNLLKHLLNESNSNSNQSQSNDNKITTKTENMIRLINRVSNRREGLKEDNLLRLFHAFLMSHITYVAAMHCWHGHEKEKLDTLIRRSIKRVLGIPMQASTERLMQLGVHNTLEEIIEAQETAQVARLSSSLAGRKILAVLGLNPTLVAERRHQLSDTQRASIQTSPFPRNVHPQHNVGRRRARAVALLRHVRDEPRSACFVDAAQYGRSARFAAVAIDHKGSILNSTSFKDSTPSRAEQAAIALALLDDSRSHIYTDSRSAVRAFASNSISDEASKILGNKIISPHTITWFPAHLDSQLDSLTNLNDTANSRARALTLRAGKDADLQGGYGEFEDILFTFNEVTKHYRMGRRTFPPPHGAGPTLWQTGRTHWQTGGFGMVVTSTSWNWGEGEDELLKGGTVVGGVASRKAREEAAGRTGEEHRHAGRRESAKFLEKDSQDARPLERGPRERRDDARERVTAETEERHRLGAGPAAEPLRAPQAPKSCTAGHYCTICEVLRSETQRQARLYRECLRIRLLGESGSSTGGKKWREFSRLVDGTTDFLWQRNLLYLRAGLPRKPPTAEGSVHKMGDVNLPDQVQRVLSLGPKFAVEPRKTPPELLTLIEDCQHVVSGDDGGDLERHLQRRHKEVYHKLLAEKAVSTKRVVPGRDEDSPAAKLRQVDITSML
ncbi:hypothetical protein HPB47_003208 [Ixodes persulcatus]|uniref:Uncharacterized protein n=1 Tax=Ixodes persulcatus TaxID=34615 RepID=A0AC60R2I2_IXOPE|nr:hypothetical protein HPB47_003208 [Ixodes persulcatus]